MKEAVDARDPRMRRQYPGRVHQLTGLTFARYEDLGGTAATIYQPRDLPMPCPLPVTE